MRIKILIFTIITFVISLSIHIGTEIYDYYSPPHEQISHLPNKNYGNDTLHIAFIGDSWALMHKYHNCIIKQYIEKQIHHPTSIISSGIGGLTSKHIYQQFFNNSDIKDLLSSGVKYCIISAGINDANMKMTRAYFKESINFIIQHLLSNHIHPIIIEIPDYDIEKAYRNLKLHRKIQTRLSMLITNTSMNCKQEFRDILNLAIKEHDYDNHATIIRYKEWNNNIEEDLENLYQPDGVHLNDKGYKKLDSCIAQHIIEIEKQND